jgi:protein-S-isoprenylcysteine O-methyltransferase Ste14
VGTLIKRGGLLVAAVLLVVLARPTPASLAAGGVLAAMGAAVRLWASGHLNRHAGLTTSGPYAYLRDPLYLGRFLLIVGLGVMGWGYDLVLMAVGLAVFFGNYMPRKRRKEMARLEGYFGEEYTRYAAQVRSLVPRLTPYPEARQKPWSFRQFWKDNREQYLFCGVLLLAGALIARYCWR